MKVIILALSMFLITGCGTTIQPGIEVRTQKVEVPIEVPCKAKMPVEPKWNVSKLTVIDDIHTKAKAFAADRQLSKGYQIELVAALNSCIKP